MKFQLLLITLFYCAYAPPPVVRVPSGSFPRLSSFGSIGRVSSSGRLSSGSLTGLPKVPSSVNLAKSLSGSSRASSIGSNPMAATIARHPSVGPSNPMPNYASRGIAGELPAAGSSSGSSTSVLTKPNYPKLSRKSKALLGTLGLGTLGATGYLFASPFIKD